jgi:iron complex transport system substrate-binding protein
VYFEEWDEPADQRHRWVSELIGIAGGRGLLPGACARVARAQPHHRRSPRGAAARPDIILGSWCGKKFQARDGCGAARLGRDPAVREGYVREIKSAIILQPGPAALTDGVRAIQEVILEWASL